MIWSRSAARNSDPIAGPNERGGSLFFASYREGGTETAALKAGIIVQSDGTQGFGMKVKYFVKIPPTIADFEVYKIHGGCEDLDQLFA